MGFSVMILGKSGTGKTSSLRNFNPDDVLLINVASKPLPFRGKFSDVLKSNSYVKVAQVIAETDKNIIVVDDAQYLMADEFMRRAAENGYTKFTEMAMHFYELLKLPQELPDEKIVYFLGHTEMDADGNEKFKTQGKMIDNAINVEGTCAIVLKTVVSDGVYSFQTQNSGKDTCKSPMGMFDAYLIDNDLKYVDDKIRSYYQFDKAKSDEEMKQADEAVVVEKEKPTRERRRRRTHTTDDITSDEPTF